MKRARQRISEPPIHADAVGRASEFKREKYPTLLKN
jgi:hypothetical protein